MKYTPKHAKPGPPKDSGPGRAHAASIGRHAVAENPAGPSRAPRMPGQGRKRSERRRLSRVGKG
ncbi:MAG TPA: hypothetical protein VHF26_14115 [Trebonia sp.]|jgi:hypothetical protein|nr:hypothetical protein [Trebonia sp.]